MLLIRGRSRAATVTTFFGGHEVALLKIAHEPTVRVGPQRCLGLVLTPM